MLKHKQVEYKKMETSDQDSSSARDPGLERQLLAARIAVTDNAENGAAWHEFGSLLLKAGRPSDARTAFERSLKLNPNEIETKQCLAATLATLGFSERARSLYRVVLRSKPTDVTVRVHYAQLLHKMGRLDEAIDAQQAAAQLAPLDASIQAELARYLLALGRTDEARVAALKATRLDPAHVMAWLALAEAASWESDWEESLAAADRVIWLSAGFTSIASYWRGVALLETQQYALALAAFELASEDTDLALRCRSQRAIACEELGDRKGALSVLSLSEANQADSILYLYSVLQEHGHADRACRILDDAHEADPSDLQVTTALGESLLVTGHAATARRKLGWALHQWPDSEPVMRMMIRACEANLPGQDEPRAPSAADGSSQSIFGDDIWQYLSDAADNARSARLRFDRAK